MADKAIAGVLRVVESEIQAGRWARARALAMAFVDDKQHGLRARSLIANAAIKMGDYAEAILQLEILLKALPSNQSVRSGLSVALNNVGSTEWQQGSFDEAETHYRKALAVDERNALAWFNFAVCVQTRSDFEEAARAFERCTMIDSSSHEARIQWAICERLRGVAHRARDVLAGFDNAKLDPQLVVRIGAEWDLLGESDAAVRAYERAESGSDVDANLILRIAQAQLESGDVTAAQSNARRAYAHASDGSTGLKASLIAALGLPAVPGTPAEIEQARSSFADGISTLETDWPTERLSASLLSLDDLAHSNYMLAYQGRQDAALARAFGHWYCAAATAIAAGKGAPDLKPGSPRSNRIALVSARWNTGTIAAYFGCWIGALVDAGWDVHLFHLGSGVDDWTSMLAQRASSFHHVPGRLDEAVEAIQNAAPTIIIYPEVGLHPRVHVLAALRLAPVQAAAWGHPVSTGLSSIDIFFQLLRNGARRRCNSLSGTIGAITPSGH